MARSRQDLDKLAEELAALSPEERARVLALVSQRGGFRPPSANFQVPVLRSAGPWDPGSLRREDLYGDDGR